MNPAIRSHRVMKVSGNDAAGNVPTWTTIIYLKRSNSTKSPLAICVPDIITVDSASNFRRRVPFRS